MSSLNPQWKNLFLEYFAASGRVGDSCLFAGITPATLYKELRIDPNFAIAMELAREVAVTIAEDEMWRRAIEGWDEPVFGKLRGKDAGEGKIGYIRKYSDNMLARIVTAYNPKYKDNKFQIEANNRNFNVNVNPADVSSLTTEELIELRDKLTGQNTASNSD